MDEDNFVYYSDEESLYTPTWLIQARGFIDVEAEDVTQLEACLNNLPLTLVSSWGYRHGHGWTIWVDEMVIKVAGRRLKPGSLATTITGSMPRRFLDPLRTQARDLVSDLQAQPRVSLFQFAVLLLQLIEAVAASVLLWKPNAPLFATPEATWEASLNGTDWHSVLTDQAGLDLSSVNDVALHLLHKPIAAICATIPSWLRLLHVEPVFRNNLVSKFLDRKSEIESELRNISYRALRASVNPTDIPYNSREDNPAGLIANLATPRVTFHGAPRNMIGSIVRHGFRKPGQAIGKSKHTAGGPSTVAVRCGSTFGAGVYSSPDAVYASSYTNYTSGTITRNGAHVVPAQVPGLRLIVCATILGRQKKVSAAARGVSEILKEEGDEGVFHSHVNANGYECIVFNTRQIIPCYVLHLDYGAERAKEELAKMPTDPQEFLRAKQKAEKRDKQREAERYEAVLPGYAKAKKEALKAAASKWFPYGFGPATGTKFVIEEVGEVDDDEEVFGDFQAVRGEYENEVRESEMRMSSGGNWFDEYQTVRKSKD